jgi:ATP/maltotriose-dependent transcriptional regulator MalT/DNA-binding SARP family transcriptional activator
MPRMPTSTHEFDRHAARVAPGPADTAERHDPGDRGLVDGSETGSLSFPVGDGVDHEPGARTGSLPAGGLEGHALVAVGPGTLAPMLPGGRSSLFGMNPLPVQGAKIHRPLLRADVLSRDRLNSWLDAAAAARLVLIVAEAGFGKTTLLADWSRQTRRLTAWYRLESDDRDWLTFVRHLVASGRELDPEFAPQTYALLTQLGPGGPTRADLVASIARELAAFAAAHPEGFSLILDDYQAVDGSDETEPIVRSILERTGPGFSVVIATRSGPHLPLGRLRARGALSRLDGDALCFDVPEADRLFRDAYRQPLEADVVADLIDRTEGWPALLSLVRTNLEESGGGDPRSLISQMSGARGHLYEYIAEEVVNTMGDDLRSFLTRVSVLDRVDVPAASLLDDRDAAQISQLIDEAEELGLIARPDREGPHRFHPLVQGFLQARLLSEVGPDGVRAIHQGLAASFEPIDWRSSAAHYRAADDQKSAERVINASVEQIMASGSYEDVREYLDGRAGSPVRPEALVLRSRVEFARGSLDTAVDLAKAAIAGADAEFKGIALLNLAAIHGIAGFPDSAVAFASEALGSDLTPTQRYVAQATVWMWEVAHEGNFASIADQLRHLATRQDREGHVRYAWITRVNLAQLLLWMGDAEEALRLARDIEVSARDRSFPDLESVAAVAAKATALAFLGRLPEASRELEVAASTRSVPARTEALLELTKIQIDFGDLSDATGSLERVDPRALNGGVLGVWALISGNLALRQGDQSSATRMLEQLSLSPCVDVAGALRTQLLRTRLAIAAGSRDAQREAEELARIANRQRSRLGHLLAGILVQVAAGTRVGSGITQLLPAESAVMSMIAEDLSRCLHRLGDEAYERVATECRSRPARWRTALGLAVTDGGSGRDRAARLLADVGNRTDLELLKSIGASNRNLRAQAVALARRLAPRVDVRDLGSVEVLVGGQPVGRPIRRKVLGLLCFLLSRPNMIATRDEALDALWPDLGPDTAANSLHQTIYFLRRVFEPDFREGFSAGYITFDGEVITLNSELVASESRRCWTLILDGRRTSTDVSKELLSIYLGRFAVDFAYEDWAVDYREHLHAAVLASVEASIGSSLAAGDVEEAIDRAQAVLALDPSADSVELALLTAYKAGGRHAAAAEQYAHYASVIRSQLGVEPPRLEDL